MKEIKQEIQNIQVKNPKDLETDSYDYFLPAELIAQRPIDSHSRDQSRLLVYDYKRDLVIHESFSRIGDYLPKESLIVFNQSKVFPSRLLGNRPTGGKVEVFLLQAMPDSENEFEVLIKTRSKKRIGDEYLFANELKAKITKVLDDGTFKVSFNFLPDALYLDRFAKIPIPPYIRDGESDEADKENYQTIYAKVIGSVAAPTAGLHFTDKLLTELKNKKIDQAFVTLHVGIGTFRPVSAKHLSDHKMHFENFFVDKENLKKISTYQNIFAVGTTSLRVLESMKRFEVLADQNYSTNIFLHPGVPVTSIKGLITNFHLPKSTLLMLVSSLIGREKALEIYKTAVENQYRFFSYGDAMLILL